MAQVKASLARARPKCIIYACSHADHLTQLYAGLYALHEAGIIQVKQRFGPHHLRRRLGCTGVNDVIFSRTLNGLFVDVEGAGLVFFEVRDGANFYQDIVERVAIYAKRSFRRAAYASNRKKFVPLGLNYAVYLDRTTYPELTKSLRQFDASRLAAKQLFVSLARLFPSLGRSLGVPTVGSFSRAARLDPSPKAIFLAKAWGPGETHDPAEATQALNDLRAGCIRALRQRFGRRFLGGFQKSDHACQHYPDCVVEAGVSTVRREYLRCLQSYSVGIATTGLYDSIGWKFAEYVALSKAIVSEPLRFELPGPLASGNNFLEFTAPESCVDQVGKLFDDEELRYRMMAENGRYHLEYGTPEAIVGRVLHASLDASASKRTSASAAALAKRPATAALVGS
jgi:hypothetical protein